MKNNQQKQSSPKAKIVFEKVKHNVNLQKPEHSPSKKANALAKVKNTVNKFMLLTNNAGSLLTDTFNFTFRIYDNYTSGNLLYETNITTATDSRGIYDIILNNVNLPFNTQYFLAVKVKRTLQN